MGGAARSVSGFAASMRKPGLVQNGLVERVAGHRSQLRNRLRLADGVRVRAVHREENGSNLPRGEEFAVFIFGGPGGTGSARSMEVSFSFGPSLETGQFLHLKLLLNM